MTSRCCAPGSHMAFEWVLFCLYNTPAFSGANNVPFVNGR